MTLNGATSQARSPYAPNGRYEGLVTGSSLARTCSSPARAGGSGANDDPEPSDRRTRVPGPQVTPYICNPNASNPPLGGDRRAVQRAYEGRLVYRNRLPNQFVAYDRRARLRRPRSSRRRRTPARRCRSSSSASPAPPSEASTRSRCSSTRRSRSRHGRRAAVEHKLFYTVRRRLRDQPHAGRARQRAPGDATRRGFAVATSNLNIFAQNCSDLTSAETTMMVKEIVIERTALLYTMGNGGSAASMQQHLLAENYPGLLDGLTTSQVFPDHLARCSARSIAACLPYFWPTSPLLNPGHATSPPNRSSRRRRRDCRSPAAIRPTRTTSAGRRSSRSAPTGPSFCPRPASRAASRRR